MPKAASNIDALLAKAATAAPSPASHSKHLHLVPVVEKLMANRFNLMSAVRWLKDQGEITEAQVDTVYRSIRQHFLRNEAKAAKA